MYEFIDRAITGLDQGGRFLIWSMRIWAKSLRGGSCPTSVIAPAFAKWRMIAGLQPFTRLMLILDRHGLQTLRFCPLGCCRVAEHEALLLSLVCSHADRAPDQLRDTLGMLVEEERLADALEALTALARAMHEAAIFPARPVLPALRHRAD